MTLRTFVVLKLAGAVSGGPIAAAVFITYDLPWLALLSLAGTAGLVAIAHTLASLDDSEGESLID